MAMGVPVASILLGSTIGHLTSPSKKVITALRHLASGIVLAALGSELVPEIIASEGTAERTASVAGFVGGALLMILMKTMLSSKNKSRSLVAALASDFFVDAVLVGMTLGLSKGGFMVTAAFSAEMFVLSLTMASMVGVEGIKDTGILIASVIAGLILGYSTSSFLEGSSTMKGLMAVGVSVIIWLVTEELLGTSTPSSLDPRIRAAMTFLGFGVVTFSEWL